MKTGAKIDAAGTFYIKRAGKLKVQLCRFGHSGGSWGFGQAPCGDWCPSFGEPVPGKDSKGKNIVYLSWCDNLETPFQEFEDERVLIRQADSLMESKLKRKIVLSFLKYKRKLSA
jgi:hypothetical protein